MSHQDVADAVTRREIYLQRFASFLVNQNVDGAIQSFSRSLPSLLNQFGAAENLTLSERRLVTRAVSNEMAKTWGIMWDDITLQLDSMALLDANHIASVYKDFLGVTLSIPSDSVILGHIKQSIMVLTSGKNVQAGVWSKYVRENITAALRQVNGSIWSGYTSNLTNDQIAQSIRGIYNRTTKTYSGGILNGITRAQSEALVRTGVSHFSNGARDKVYADNTDIIQSRVLLATLDSRTTLICMGRDKREWLITDKSYPRLPFHFNERSIYIVRLSDDDSFDDIDTAQSFDEFLRKQPKSFVEDTLGKARANLFLNKNFSVKRFTDMTGRTLPLDELGVVKP